MNKQIFNENYNPKYREFFQLCEHIGDSLNGRKDRFDKADLFEAALEAATHGILEWVDDIGFDLQDKRTGMRFECKTQRDLFWTKTGRVRRSQSTSEVKLTNTLQQAENKSLDVTADYLILIDTTHYAMGIIPYKDVVENYTLEKKDGFSCVIPLSAIEMLHETHDKSWSDVEVDDYKETKKNVQKEYVRSFFNEV